MAFSALQTKLAFMCVVHQVAATAARGHVCSTRRGFAMTVNAIEPCVSAVQTEVGMQIVVEGRHQPFIAVVTAAAVTAEGAVMHILVAVTVRAAVLGVVETIAHMTGTAGDRSVQPDQWESGQVMVKKNHLPPRLL